MTGFSPGEAATEGFRLTRERPQAIGVWVVAYFGFTILLGWIAAVTLGPRAQEMLAEIKSAPSGSDAFWTLAAPMWPFFAAGVPVNLAFQSIFTCAVYRAILHPEDARSGYMRIGADELRMAGVNLLVSVIWTVAIFGVSLVGLMMATTTGVIGSPVVSLLGFLVSLGALGVAIWILVRLSLAGAITFSEHRIQIWKSWSLTQGRFWPLFSAYVLAFILGVIFFVVMSFVLSGAYTLIEHVSGLNLTRSETGPVTPLIFLAGLITSAGTALLLSCGTVILTAPSAEAYRELTEP